MPVEALKNAMGCPLPSGELFITRLAIRAIRRLLSLRTTPRKSLC
jgi:hypothetical protein